MNITRQLKICMKGLVYQVISGSWKSIIDGKDEHEVISTSNTSKCTYPMYECE